MRFQDPLPDHSQSGVRTQFRAGLPERKTSPELVFLRVGVAGFEPTASSSRTKRATKLRHTPRRAEQYYMTPPDRQIQYPGPPDAPVIAG